MLVIGVAVSVIDALMDVVEGPSDPDFDTLRVFRYVARCTLGRAGERDRQRTVIAPGLVIAGSHGPSLERARTRETHRDIAPAGGSGGTGGTSWPQSNAS